MQFSDEEVQNLREIFDLFDKERNGTIYIKDLEQIISEQILQIRQEKAI